MLPELIESGGGAGPMKPRQPGGSFQLGNRFIVQVPNPARCSPPNAESAGEDKERVPARRLGACPLVLKLEEDDPR